MKKILILLVALCLCLGLCACGDPAEKDSGKEKITLCLDWTPNTNHSGIYAALSEGYYAEEGLEVTVVQPPEGGAELMTASGQSHFGISAQDTLAATFSADEPLGITAVATILQHNTSGIISLDCESPRDLEGKRYSTWDIPTEQAIIRHVMEKDGGDFSKVKLIPNAITNEAEALRNGDTDAVWIYYAWSGINAELSGLPFEYFGFADLEKDLDFYTPVIIANNSFLQESPDTAKAFLRATAKGYEFAAENPEKAAEILIAGDTTGSLVGSEALVTESQKWISAQYIADAEKWGVIDPQRWNAFYGWLNDKGLVENPLGENTGFSNEYLS